MQKIQWLIRQEDLDRFRDVIRRENRTSLRLMAVTGCILSVVNMATQMVATGYSMSFFRSSLLLACFSAMLFIDRVIIPEEAPVPTWAMYLAQAPVFLLAILLGTVWDKDHQATTVMLFMLASPVFILDHPKRSLSIITAWCGLFILLARLMKGDPLRDVDTIHAVEFLVACVAITYTSVQIRLKNLKENASLKLLLDHDRNTGCLNRHAFEERTGKYAGGPLTVLMADIDQLTLYNDFYGRQVGDDIIHFFVQTMMEHFGPENTFLYGQEEVLCLVPGNSREKCEQLAAQCRKETHGYTREGYRITVTFSVGCADGTPQTKEDVLSMVHLAQIYSHRANALGRDESCYGTYSEEALQEATADANISAKHLKAYEKSPLSGLPTMTYFCMRVDEMMTNMVQPEDLPVVGYFKLTMLKEYNDEFGYQQGDQLIADTGKVLQEVFPYRLIGHITAGQFCFFVYLNEAQDGIEQTLKNLQKMHPEFPIRGKAGIAEPAGKESASELLDLARIAQRSIMDRHDRVCCEYNLDLDEEIRFRQYIVNHLDVAIEQEWLQVYYQPIVRASTGLVCHEEALSRWNDPVRGLLTPAQFIPPLEEKGLMHRLNLHVVERVLKDCRRREELGVPVVPVSVNLSRNDFLQCDMAKEISDRVSAAGYGPDILRIEITESAFVSDQALLSREVRRFRELGFRVWMDDFGSEYSTLNLLQELDFDLVKIDMQFMKNLAPGGKNYIIVSNAIRMLREMGTGTLMEGVETEEQRRMLQDMGCGLLQGFLFNRPNPFEYIAERALNGTGLKFEKPEEEVPARE